MMRLSTISIKHLSALGTSVVALALIPGSALAQQADNGTPAADDTGISDIVVTAQRKTETLQKAAVAVSVVAIDDVAKAQVAHPSQLATLVPALDVGTIGGTSATFFIRGVGTLSANSYTDPGVAFNYDGVYIGRPVATSGMFYDLARVEVLKGPQGTLYGRNASGGAINVLPAPPVLEKTTGLLSASYGNYNTVDLEGAINLPVGSNVAFRLSGQFSKHDGYLTDGASDLDSRGLRAQMLFQPSADTKLRLSFDYFERYGQGVGGVIIGTVATNPFINVTTVTPTGLPRNISNRDPSINALLASTFSPISGRTFNPFSTPGKLDGQFWGLHAVLEQATPLGTLTVIPAYRKSQLDDIQSTGFNVSDKTDDSQFSLEARLSNTVADGKLDYIFGGFYFDENQTSRFVVNTQVLQAFQNFKSTVKSYAGFARLTYHVSDKVRLVGGFRYTNDRKTFVGSAETFIAACNAPTGQCPGAPLLPYAVTPQGTIDGLGLVALPIPGLYAQPSPAAANSVYIRKLKAINKGLSQSKPTFRAAVEYDAGPRSLLYASFETGFRSGGFAFALARNTFNPESINAFTIGSKNRFFDNKLQLNIEGFYWKYKDQQASHLVTDIDGGPVFITENIGRSSIKGAEVSVEFMPVRNTLVGADIQYLDAEYDQFSYQNPGTANPILSTPGNTVYLPQLNGCPVSAPVAGQFTINCSGRTPPYSSKWTLSGRIQQTIPIGENRLVVSARTRYQSGAYVGFNLLPIDYRPGYWRSDADLTFYTMGDRVSITAYINNIENNRILQASLDNSSASTIVGTYGDPRTYGIRVGFKF